MTDPERVYLAYNDAENNHDAETAAALLAPHLTVEVNGRPALSSPDDDRAANAELLRRYPDYRREVVDVMVSGDRGTIRWRMCGTPVDPDVEPLDVQGCSVVTVREGRIAQAFLYYNGAALNSVLGAVS
ncbi:MULTISPECIES: nuclear transport factor 2 family protein [Prauserella]|uniref:Nuclear transport factor 2 family protein n=1 Tax=Prauserella endophytica TaxID=1592324 RepID=A0ABY2RU83_9PSEU|nr:nuclear transport factor 2 family protein [Prauserella endophytica]TKG60800.1 nuclear transport factor 2 family protein [Prauserella endophytica]